MPNRVALRLYCGGDMSGTLGLANFNPICIHVFNSTTFKQKYA